MSDDNTILRKITNAISNAGIIMTIKLIDHIILTDTEYFSFADEGMIN